VVARKRFHPSLILVPATYRQRARRAGTIRIWCTWLAWEDDMVAKHDALFKCE
jgi:hypothetical protein